MPQEMVALTECWKPYRSIGKPLFDEEDTLTCSANAHRSILHVVGGSVTIVSRYECKHQIRRLRTRTRSADRNFTGWHWSAFRPHGQASFLFLYSPPAFYLSLARPTCFTCFTFRLDDFPNHHPTVPKWHPLPRSASTTQSHNSL